MPPLATLWRHVASGALAVLYPPSCVVCAGATAQAHALCPGCWAELRLIERPYCERLGTPFAVDLGVGPLLSPRAIAEPPVFEAARAVSLYDGAARDLVHRLKYGDRLDLARVMARMMAVAGAALLAEADLIVPVPMHATRLWRRRFNQAALLARHVGALADRPVALRTLRRVKATRQQVGLTRHQRAENLRGAFGIPLHARAVLQGRRILVVDDVMTTGATGNAAARVLLRAGARRVDLLTFATVATETL